MVIAGATIDLCLAVLFQQRPRPLSLPQLDALKRSPFTFPHAFLVLMATLLFAASALVQTTGAPPPSEVSLILGPVFYALAGLLVTAFCLHMTRRTFWKTFSPGPNHAAHALAKGVLYGLAIIPPVVVLSLCTATATEGLGFESQLQEVFDWLADDRISGFTRGFMIFAAVVIAPVVEETLFRGILLSTLLKGRSFASAALLSGIYFALVHFHAPSLLPLLALSVAFSAAYAATGSILTPIVMHALFNTTSLLLYLAGKG
jgi:hypothetical protein